MVELNIIETEYFVDLKKLHKILTVTEPGQHCGF